MAEPVLRAERLSRGFGALRAVDEVTLELRPGEIHALIGPNGAGKSTLIRLIAGEVRPDAGQVLLLGRDVSRLDVARRARMGLGRTFQVSSVAPDFSVLQNVALAVLGSRGGVFGLWRNVMRDEALTGPAREAIADAGLSGRGSVPAAALSHGERRKLEIAMALALQPRLLLLDEPMAGMGVEGAAELGALLSRLRTRVPILLVEHDMDAVFALSDRVSVLAEGRLIASGTGAEIRADADVRRVYLGEAA